MSMLVFMIADPTVNKDRLIKVCLVHDLAEAEVGDITPHAGISKEDKRKLEEVRIRLMYLKLSAHLMYHTGCFETNYQGY
jgi:5'-deoxynucleotidase YfbR-like HD superfamily hydrolase